jgi:YgiT-type zinc finger domain-containing protein
VGHICLGGILIYMIQRLELGFVKPVGILKMKLIRKLTCWIFGHCYYSLENMSAYICVECGKEMYDPSI